MNVSNLSSSGIFATNIGASPSVAAPAADPDRDGDSGTVRAAHRHAGGHPGHAVMQALQSLGLSVPSSATDASGNRVAGDSSSNPAVSASPGAPTNVRQDLHDFMHTLFEAVKGEQSTAGGATNGAADPSHASSSFASGLSALLSNVSNGDAPPDLRAAFAKLASDLQGGAASGAAAPTLQAFLSKLQDAVGYGAVGGTTNSGTLMSSAA